MWEIFKAFLLAFVGKMDFFKQIDLRDMTVFTGIGLVGYGMWLLHPPFGFISSGVILLYIGLRKL